MQRTLIVAVAVGLGVASTGGLLPPGHVPATAGEPPPPARKGAGENPAGPPLIRSARSGAWSAASTWEGGKVPAAGSRVQVREGHTVVYDLKSDAVIRSIHVAGTLTFARDRDTRLDVGLIKIQPGDDASENGFDCDAHLREPDASKPRPALEVGSQAEPIPAGRTALIRLTHVDGLDRQSCPAVVCCGGRMDFHGTPLARTWGKLARSVQAGDDLVEVLDSLAGWKAGDRVILTGTHRPPFDFKESVFPRLSQTEERKVVAAEPSKHWRTGWTLKLDKPAAFGHYAEGDYRGEVANLSRNVVVESAAPDGVRGHTMYHRHSGGSISYAEFRHLGKRDALGRYSLHFHLCRDTMRGSSVIGASIWDSHNRWLTVHGTQYLVVRDCVGYKSVGHGFFLEDGTETHNVLDRNLAALVLPGKPLPDQVLPFDQNRGAGFWWANCLNSFTRNVAAECAEYGYNFEAVRTDTFDPVLPVLQPDGSRKKKDIRTLPFVRFEDNEGHSLAFFGLNLRGAHRLPETGVHSFRVQNKQLAKEAAEAYPDSEHPFHVRRLRIWDANWSFHAGTTGVFLDGFDVYRSFYGNWRSIVDRHTYRNVTMREIVHRDLHMPLSMAPPDDAGEGSAGGDYYAGVARFKDDQPPVTVVTHARREKGRLVVRGVTADSGPVKQVTVNGRRAHSTRDDFAEWEVELEAPVDGKPLTVSASAEDAAGNVETSAHRVAVP